MLVRCINLMPICVTCRNVTLVPVFKASEKERIMMVLFTWCIIMQCIQYTVYSIHFLLHYINYYLSANLCKYWLLSFDITILFYWTIFLCKSHENLLKYRTCEKYDRKQNFFKITSGMNWKKLKVKISTPMQIPSEHFQAVIVRIVPIATTIITAR